MHCKSYGSIKILKWFVFPLLVGKMVHAVLSSQLTQVISGTCLLLPTFRPILQSRTELTLQWTFQMRFSKPVLEWARYCGLWSLFLLTFAEVKIYLYVALKEHFLMLREAAVLSPAYLRRVRSVLLLRILRV